MGDYTNMSAYYDAIMTSGYYDYAGIVDSLLTHQPFANALEIGCGTGLILDELATRQPRLALTGIDLTEAMLVIAQQRLQKHANITLLQGDVIRFQLAQQYEMAFSYGGVWYFVIDGDKEPLMVSHLAGDADNHQGLARLAAHVRPGGTLLLGIQGPHHNYERVISNGMCYSQTIAPSADGFTKNYYLADGPNVVMTQVLQYRTYGFADACRMLSAQGFEYAPQQGSEQRFLAFTRH